MLEGFRERAPQSQVLRADADGRSGSFLNIFISCGEPSGDLYAGALTRALKELDDSVHVFGLGGSRLREAGADVVEDFGGLTAI